MSITLESILKPVFVRKGFSSLDFHISLKAHVQKKYFKAWRLGAGMDKKEPTETDPIVSKDGKEDKQVQSITIYY